MPLSPSSFEQFFSQSPSGAYLLSPSDDPVILAVNHAFLRDCGRKREDLVGRRLFEAFPGNADDTGDTGVSALRASLARVIATGRPDELPAQRYPIVVREADGTEHFDERFWRARSSPIFDAAGQLVGIAHRTEDVTEQVRIAQALERSNQRQSFQLALSDSFRDLASPEEIAVTAAAMLGRKLGLARVTYVEVDDTTATFVQRHWMQSGSAPQSTARRRLEEFGPEVIATLHRGEAVVMNDVATDPRAAAFAQAYASIGVRSNVAIPLLKSGRLSIVLSLQDAEPRVWTPFEIDLARDVAERTWSAAETARAQEELREANRRKDEFLAMLAHELRNPLAPISAAAAILSRPNVSEQALQKTSAIIARQVRHMTGLVDDLLDVSRVTRGLVTLAEQPQDVKAIVAGAVEQARPLVEANAHRLTLDLPAVNATVRGDGKRLVQVVSNLLNNAAKYTPSGGHIHLSVEVGAQQVHIHVKDNGIGIAKDLQPRIFELFAQAERTPDRSQGGLGLGLALVKSLVELHRGTVHVSSDGPAAGSCFTVCLPRIEPPRLESAAAAQPVQPAVHSLDMLVVDDNADAAEMLQLVLETAGHRVRVATDPYRALETALEAAPQAGLIDIGLPGMDGYDLVRRLRAAPGTSNGFYVALTGYGQETDRGKALAAGFDDHLVKPADPKRLLAMLERAAR
jgi:signal transduction histidine kinase/CheY-like chemotaxis protein